MINVFYQTHINYVGGVETFLYELARLSNNAHRDFTIVYRTGDAEQIKRLKKYCRCVSLREIEKPIKCKKAFFNYGLDAIDSFEAEEYIQVIHADFKDKSLVNYPISYSDKITKLIAVSEVVADSYFDRTGIRPEVMYNPLLIDDEPRIMTLISAQRITSEKGVSRIERLVSELDKHHINYAWHMFTKDRLKVESENVFYHTPTLDIRKWIKYSDYMVLLSDTEGFGYGAYEALSMGVPVIITRLPVLPELGVTKDNSIVLDFDFANLDVNEIYSKAGTFKFKYTQKECKWINLLQGKSDYIPPKMAYIKATLDYTDVELDRKIKKGEIYEVTEQRANHIISLGFATLEDKE